MLASFLFRHKGTFCFSSTYSTDKHIVSLYIIYAFCCAVYHLVKSFIPQSVQFFLHPLGGRFVVRYNLNVLSSLYNSFHTFLQEGYTPSIQCIP